MLQLAVEKQGRLFFANWSQRILSVDPDERSLFISRKDKPETVLYGKMYPVSVEPWPFYCPSRLYEPVDGVDAQLSVLITGYPADPSPQDVQRSLRTRPSSENTSCNATMNTVFWDGGILCIETRSQPSDSQPSLVWFLRCASKKHLDELMCALKSFMNERSINRSDIVRP